MSFLNSKSVACPPTCVCACEILALTVLSPVQFSISHTVFFCSLFPFPISTCLPLVVWNGFEQQQQQVQVTLKQFARDWSTDGEEERQQCYAPIINEIEKFYSADKV